MALKFLYIVMLFCSHIRLSLSGETKVMESVPDLYNSMYKVVDSFPCVRLLNISGEIGCSNPGRQRIVAPIIRFKDANTLSRSSTILLSVDEVQSFFVRIEDDSSFAQKIGGVLVESGTGSQDMVKGFSPAQKFPQAEFASYRSTNYEWNPVGSGTMWNKYNFPVFLLSDSSTITVQEAILENEKKKISYTSAVAEFDLVMQTMKSGHHDSESCLKEGTCLPLGGYSVWSAFQPINNSSSDQGKPVILTVASMDSASFFRDKSIGADSPISGPISLLAAVEALSRLNALDLKKQLVFLVLTGESWGYLGSRRFLHELDLQSDAVTGLNGSLFDVVVEVGSVGKGFNQGAYKFYAHDTGGSSGTKVWHALKQAEDSLKSENISVSTASTSNPGIPPSSLMPFLRKNPLLSGVVLEDFDTIFSNKFYNSHLDDSSNVDTSSVVAAASLLARTLYTLATDSDNLSASTLASINVNASLVQELMDCLVSCGPGLSCELVRSYIVPSSSSACPSNYVGVMVNEPSSAPPIQYVSDISRFVWNFLADKTSVLHETTSSICSHNCSSNGRVCIRAETDGKGVCVFSTTRYVPAYSTRLEIKDGMWVVLPPNTSDPMGIIDPIWTESNWNTIGLRVYTVQTGAYDYAVLLAGVAITALAYVAIVIARASIAKMMKLD